MNDFVLITGSSKGLGKALALEFSKNNYNIILHGRAQEGLDRVKEEIIKNNVECEIVIGDLCEEETIKKLKEKAEEKNISILINNAGIDNSKEFEELSELEIMNVLETNLIAPIKLIEHIYPLFLNKKSGTIVNIISTSGLKTETKGKTAYSASKFGLRGFTDALRYEAKTKNVRVISVYPGGMKTDMYARSGKDMTKCMDTSEVAKIIYDSCKDYKSSMVDEIIIVRRNC